VETRSAVHPEQQYPPSGLDASLRREWPRRRNEKGSDRKDARTYLFNKCGRGVRNIRRICVTLRRALLEDAEGVPIAKVQVIEA
jgi:hypothetical protein